MYKNATVLKYFVLLLSCFCVGIVSAIDVSSDSINKKSSVKEEVILIQSAAHGSIEKDKTEKNLYIVTLQKVMPYLSYVADRPSRSVGKITLEKYLKLWIPRDENSFQSSPPNAIIHASASGNSETAKPQYFALEISEPKYDSNTETLVYKAKPLIGDGSDIPDTATFNHITLIIDDVCIGCWN